MSKGHKILLIVWTALVILFAGVLLYRVASKVEIRTSILDLIPASQKDPVVEKAYNTYTERLSRKIVFLVGAENKKKAISSAKKFVRKLVEDKSLLQDVVFEIQDDRAKGYYDLFFKNRFWVVSKQNYQLLSSDHQKHSLVQKAKQILYSPLAGTATALIEKDPLFLFYDFVSSIQRDAAKFTLEDKYLVTEEAGSTYVLVTAVSKKDVFAQSHQKKLIDQINKAADTVRSSSKNGAVLWTGFLKYGNDAASAAESEVSLIGTGSIVGIILLMLVSFGSLRQLLIGFLPVATGIIAAFAICTLVFDDLHIITLVFGASLIGVCIDYSFHYLSHRFISNQSESGYEVLAKVKKGITLGMITSAIGYLSILVAPFSALRQMAIFSTVGLIASYLSVISYFPLFTLKKGMKKEPPPLRISSKYLSLFEEYSSVRPVWIVSSVVLVCLGLFVFNLKTDDDIRLLGNQNQTLIDEEKKISCLTDSFDKSRFILVEGKDTQELLQNEETLTIHLDELIAKGSIKSYRAISALVPSKKRQGQTLKLVKNVIGSADFSAYAAELGFHEGYAKEIADQLKNPSFWSAKTISTNPVLKPFSHMWLGRTERGYASVIMLDTVKKQEDLLMLHKSFPFARYVDKVSQISSLFKKYRFVASLLLLFAYILIFALLLVRYGLRMGIRVILPPIVTAVSILGFMGMAGISANLFTFLALLLVLGISIDYTIFFAESKGDSRQTAFAVFLSAITTCLSFGLLALSKTPSLSAFGITVLIGIAIAAFLSPLCRSKDA